MVIQHCEYTKNPWADALHFMICKLYFIKSKAGENNHTKELFVGE